LHRRLIILAMTFGLILPRMLLGRATEFDRESATTTVPRTQEPCRGERSAITADPA
jgi:hypothetical protein